MTDLHATRIELPRDRGLNHQAAITITSRLDADAYRQLLWGHLPDEVDHPELYWRRVNPDLASPPATTLDRRR
jgi:hypothetical protein